MVWPSQFFSLKRGLASPVRWGDGEQKHLAELVLFPKDKVSSYGAQEMLSIFI